MQSGRIRKINQIIAILWFVNFAAFFCIAIWIGGDAINGRESAGRYYVANHGALTEVSRNVFLYSKIHIFTLWVHTGLVFATSFYDWAKGRWPHSN